MYEGSTSVVGTEEITAANIQSIINNATISLTGQAIYNAGILTINGGKMDSSSGTVATIADSKTATTNINGGTITHDGNMRTVHITGTATQNGSTISGGKRVKDTAYPTFFVVTGGHFTYSSGSLSGPTDKTYLIYVEKSGNAFQAGEVTKRTYPPT